MKLMGTTFEPVIGNEALIISLGTILTVKLNTMTSTASVCSAEEIDALTIKCGVTFANMNSWDLDEALCEPDSCSDVKGAVIHGGPVYSPDSSVCLAADGGLGRLSSGLVRNSTSAKICSVQCTVCSGPVQNSTRCTVDQCKNPQCTVYSLQCAVNQTFVLW